MRRTTAGVLIGGEAAAPALPYPIEAVIAALEPICTERRVARIRGVLDRRLAAVTLVVDALHDPHNGAAITRSCEAFGVQTVHAIEGAEPLAVARAVTKGSEKWIDLLRHPSAEACLSTLRAGGHELVATHPDGELLPDDLATIPKVALVLGNEHRGIAPELRAACTRAVRVPMVGFVESLNVSVTAAIVLHAATRGRPGDLDGARKRALFARALWLSVPQADALVAAHLARLARPASST